jgi:transcriptional regulator with PAS, ATPase and Fis domain
MGLPTHNHYHESALPGLIGTSTAIANVGRIATRMARSGFPVLIVGETGTGKEIVARSIHRLQGRGGFVVVDCSSLVSGLIESELFGYARGAFTGAHTPKQGLLDAANGGTAFFDEVGELPLEAQQKLLRALQEKEFRAVGAVTQRQSSFRIIAATNRNLAIEVEKGRFREDLYYRLNVMRLRIAPLRERKEDIPALVEYFIAKHGTGQRVSVDVMNALLRYDWPGNVRELEHAVQHMISMNSGPCVDKGDLPSSILNKQGDTIHHSTLTPIFLEGEVLPLAEVEKRAILEALEVAKGDRTLAAGLLRIGRTTLYRKLKEFGV